MITRHDLLLKYFHHNARTSYDASYQQEDSA